MQGSATAAEWLCVGCDAQRGHGHGCPCLDPVTSPFWQWLIIKVSIQHRFFSVKQSDTNN